MFEIESWDSPVIMPDVAPPEEHCCDDFVYVVWNGYARIVRYRGKKETVQIPAELDSCPVIAVESGAFMDNGWIRDLSVPGCVNRIGNHAFLRCPKLEMVVLREGVQYIGIGAFQSCRKIELISTPSSISFVGDHAFMDTSILRIEGYAGTVVQEYCDDHGICFMPVQD